MAGVRTAADSANTWKVYIDITQTVNNHQSGPRIDSGPCLGPTVQALPRLERPAADRVLERSSGGFGILDLPRVRPFYHERERRRFPMPTFTLNTTEKAELDTIAVGDGGFQTLIRRLQDSLNPGTGEIHVSTEDVARLRAYCNNYGAGGWQARLKRAFSRVIEELDAQI